MASMIIIIIIQNITVMIIVITRIYVYICVYIYIYIYMQVCSRWTGRNQRREPRESAKPCMISSTSVTSISIVVATIIYYY